MSQRASAHRDRLSDPQAEAAVVAAITLQNAAYDVAVSGGLVAEDFTTYAYRTLFESISALIDEGKPVDLVTLRNDLETRGELERVGNVPVLMGMIESAPSVYGVAEYARIVREKSCARRLVRAAQVTEHDLVKGGKVSEARDELLKAIEGLLVVPERDAGWIKDFIRRGVGLEAVKGLSWPWVNFSKRTGGIPSGLTVIGAYPSIGKTAFVTTSLLSLCKAEIPVALFSLEMSACQLIATILSRESGVSVSSLLRSGIGGLSDEPRARIEAKSAELSNLPFYLIAGCLSSAEAVAYARTLIRRYRIKALGVDYLQLLRHEGEAESRRVAIDDDIRQFKGLATSSGISVIVLSQLSRNLAGGMKPSSALLKESGGILEAADQVLILDRPNFRKWEPCPNCNETAGNSYCPKCGGAGSISCDDRMTVKVEKNRFGEAGFDGLLSWYGPAMRISEWRGLP